MSSAVGGQMIAVAKPKKEKVEKTPAQLAVVKSNGAIKSLQKHLELQTEPQCQFSFAGVSVCQAGGMVWPGRCGGCKCTQV
jgi:hypothetical protein